MYGELHGGRRPPAAKRGDLCRAFVIHLAPWDAGVDPADFVNSRAPPPRARSVCDATNRSAAGARARQSAAATRSCKIVFDEQPLIPYQ